MEFTMNSTDKDTSLKGLVALVTGSTSGIGLGIVHSLARRGCNVIIHGLGDEKHCNAIQSEVTQLYSVSTHLLKEDLSKVSDIQKLHDNVLRFYPEGIDILVNNAGFQHVSPIEQFPIEKWDAMVAVMLSAPFHLSRLFLPYMKTKGWGRIINMSSSHGHVASPNKTAYVTCKHGIIGLTKAVAVEVAGTGITCNAICPGYVETPLFQKQADDISKNKGITVEEAKAQIVDVHATKQAVPLEHVGELAAFICSRAGDQMTGSSLVVDGGWISH